MATFLTNTRTELWKCRRSAAFWITLAGTALIPIILTIAYIVEPEEFIGDLGQNPWINHIKNMWQIAAAFFFPMFVVIVASLIVQIEYRNNTWKQVYASPRSYADIFFSKFVIIQLMILAAIFMFVLYVLASASIANIFRPKYTFLSSPVPWVDLLKFTGKQYIAILGMSAIQYWLSLRIRNYIAPLGVGLALIIAGIIILGWEKVIYYPYAYTAVTFFKNKQSNGLNIHEVYSLVWLGVVLLLAFLDTSRSKERG